MVKTAPQPETGQAIHDLIEETSSTGPSLLDRVRRLLRMGVVCVAVFLLTRILARASGLRSLLTGAGTVTAATITAAGAATAAESSPGVPGPPKQKMTLLTALTMLVVPAALSAALTSIQGMFPIWTSQLVGKVREWVDGKQYTRTVEFRTRYNQYGYQMSDRSNDHRNNLLQKAISLKLAMEDKALGFDTAQVSLAAVSTNKPDDSDSDDEDNMKGTVAAQLKKLKVSVVPPVDEWVRISPLLEFKESTDEKKKNNSGSTERDQSRTVVKTHMFRSSAPNARQVVGDYVQGAYQWYINELKSQEDTGRYMYNPIPKSEGHWKRYKLSDDKSFDCLFFPQKVRLLSFVEQFRAKAGKFSIDGYPHKMGLLLHGPPGTGKTSLIKAMAQHMDRNIVNIPLSRIKTNQQLMDLVFDQSFNVPGMDGPVGLQYSQTIFVFEDVDAAGRVVHMRDLGQEPDSMLLKDSIKRTNSGDHTAPSLTRSGSRVAPASTDSQAEGDVTAHVLRRGDSGGAALKIEEVDSGAKAEEGAEGEVGAKAEGAQGEEGAKAEGAEGEEGAKAEGAQGEGAKAEEDDEEEEEGKAKGGGATGASQSENDKLDLAGVLNVLDGVVDCPGRVVIMTTNHPEKLDPALIRPGRINLKIYLGYIEATEAMLMAEHYFGGYKGVRFSAAQQEQFQAAFGKLTREDGAKLNLTPAQLEQLCAENDSVDGMCKAFERLAAAADANQAAADAAKLTRQQSQ